MPQSVATKIQNAQKPLLSVEFFPPKTPQGYDSLHKTVGTLVRECNIDYVSVTQKTGRVRGNVTQQLVIDIVKQYAIPAVAHLTCVGNTKKEVYELIETYTQHDIVNLLALRGDRSENTANDVHDFTYASELVAFIHANFSSMSLGVAGFAEGHPECPNRLKEIEYLKQKIDAGAHYIVTQLFFDTHDFYDFVERCRIAGITVPIVAGILPIVSITQMHRMVDLATRARIPAKLLQKLYSCKNETEQQAVGMDWAVQQATELYDAGVSLHIYSLNNREVSLQLLQSIRAH